VHWCQFRHEAELVRSALEAFGVPAWVRGNGRPDGHSEVFVRARDADSAREILGGDHSAGLAATAEAHLPPAPDELCPRCGSESVDRVVRRLRRDTRRCRACAHAWRG
jgi:hypothetical protein